jgi:hypothetical protein
MDEGASQLILDSCELTFSGTMTLQVTAATFVNVLHFAGRVTVADGTALSVAAGSSLTFAAGFISVEDGGKFTVESSRLAGAGGAGCERAALPLRAASPTYAGTYP